MYYIEVVVLVSILLLSGRIRRFSNFTGVGITVVLSVFLTTTRGKRKRDPGYQWMNDTNLPKVPPNI